jgi:cell division protein FtsA
MAQRRIATGIDIGTHQTKIVVVEEIVGENGPELHIIGTGMAETHGMRHGYVVDAADAVESVRAAKLQAESITRMPIKNAFLAIGGISLDELRATGDCIISRADQEVTDLDIQKAREVAREAVRPNFVNRSMLHEIPLEYRLDGHKTLGEPLGLKGIYR